MQSENPSQFSQLSESLTESGRTWCECLSWSNSYLSHSLNFGKLKLTYIWHFQGKPTDPYVINHRQYFLLFTDSGNRSKSIEEVPWYSGNGKLRLLTHHLLALRA